ncbi:hypothetical protein DL89DRAFT_24394 [Linderina pennispora]|uniref:Uncharacterized protein n=1 Tax=Linderina pennispora TaxID=61395 RepID=A0A1Y1WMY3_9FUNG|nr:uncharacterized protein DL89DRAFT_24394 [Linderina pennispora]ORX74927.1 hypothetical protein DL89DRAFT_24394 [Linderina pennispora]
MWRGTTGHPLATSSPMLIPPHVPRALSMCQRNIATHHPHVFAKVPHISRPMERRSPPVCQDAPPEIILHSIASLNKAVAHHLFFVIQEEMRLAFLVPAFLALVTTVLALTAAESTAVDQFLEDTKNVGKKGGKTNVELVHDLAVSLGMRNSASKLYKDSPDAKAAYDAIYDTLLFLSTSSFSMQEQKIKLNKVAKYFESNLL